jgi:hypothetical protein
MTRIDLATLINEHHEGILGTISAASAAAVAYFTFTIWGTNKRQLERSEDVERAYMSAGGAPQMRELSAAEMAALNLQPPPPPGARVRIPTDWFQFDINNHGKTKGEILEYGYGWWEADKLAELPRLPPYKWVEFRDQIGPGVQSRGIKRIKIPSNRTVIFGRIGYRDIFGKPHSHGFMQELGKPIAPPHRSYTETDPPWDLPTSGRETIKRKSPKPKRTAHAIGSAGLEPRGLIQRMG